MSNVYHSGELSVQRLAGQEITAQQNSRIVRTTIPKGAVAFLKSLSLLIVASIDERGRVWSSLLTGEPGFIDVEDEVTITIHSSPVLNDPLNNNLISGSEMGLLAIDFSKRMRLRMNGKGYLDTDRRVVVKTEQVYGNCPQYIHKRTLSPNAVFQRSQKSEQHSLNLNEEQQVWIRKSDTFFIGSSNSEGKVDVSHRGGASGFIKVIDEKTLLFPDYSGNSMFNTLGNIYSNPSSGLLFIDFDSGHSLQLTGKSEIIWDVKEITVFPEVERIVRFEVDEVLFTENNTQLSWDFLEFSPSIPPLQSNKKSNKQN